MSAIREIQNVEEAMEALRAQSRAEAAQLVAEAEKEGRALLAEGRKTAADAAERAMAAAEEQGAKRREEILSDAREACEALKTEAQANMAQAVNMIMERVVGA